MSTTVDEKVEQTHYRILLTLAALGTIGLSWALGPTIFGARGGSLAALVTWTVLVIAVMAGVSALLYVAVGTVNETGIVDMEDWVVTAALFLGFLGILGLLGLFGVSTLLSIQDWISHAW